LSHRWCICWRGMDPPRVCFIGSLIVLVFENRKAWKAKRPLVSTLIHGSKQGSCIDLLRFHCAIHLGPKINMPQYNHHKCWGSDGLGRWWVPASVWEDPAIGWFSCPLSPNSVVVVPVKIVHKCFDTF
jgi:hypothetical protein